jgi:hypothetical protein
MMREIYAKTQHGLLWLGDYEEGSLLKPNTSQGGPTGGITRATAVKAFAAIRHLARNGHFGFQGNASNPVWPSRDDWEPSRDVWDSLGQSWG